MKNDDKKRKNDKTIITKKDWIWIVTLLFGGITVIFALFVDMGIIEIGCVIDKICKIEVRNVLWQASETVCNVTVTYTTMLAAIIVFFYSVIDNKRLGIPYRRLISYTIGSRTIPVLFMTTLLLTVFMVIVRFLSLKYTVYSCFIYILMVQIFVIIQILVSTSYQHCKRVICQLERKRYLKGAGSEEIHNMEWAYFFGHLERAIHSEEFIPDKEEVLAEFLQIPFCRCTGELNKIIIGKKELTGMEELGRIYQFYYVNILSAFQNFDGEAKHLERNQLYMRIRDFVKELSDKIIKNDIRMQFVYHMILSGILNGLVSSNVEDNNQICSYILSKCIQDDSMSKRQLHLFLLFQELLSIIDLKKAQRQIRISGIRGWEPIKAEEMEFYAKFWDIWTQIHDLSFIEKVQHFGDAMQTMTGRCNASAPILNMLLAMTEKDKTGENINGSKDIDKDTTV